MKKLIKYPIFSVLLLTFIFFIADVKAESNTLILSDSWSINPFNKLQQDDSAKYNSYSKIKNEMDNTCAVKYGADYEYFIQYRADIDSILKGYCWSKGTLKHDLYFDIFNGRTQQLGEWIDNYTVQLYIGLNSNGTVFSYIPSTNRVQTVEAISQTYVYSDYRTISVSNSTISINVFPKNLNLYIDTNLDIKINSVHLPNGPYDWEVYYTTFNINRVEYKKDDKFISNNELYNPVEYEYNYTFNSSKYSGIKIWYDIKSDNISNQIDYLATSTSNFTRPRMYWCDKSNSCNFNNLGGAGIFENDLNTSFQFDFDQHVGSVIGSWTKGYLYISLTNLPDNTDLNFKFNTKYFDRIEYESSKKYSEYVFTDKYALLLIPKKYSTSLNTELYFLGNIQYYVSNSYGTANDIYEKKDFNTTSYSKGKTIEISSSTMNNNKPAIKIINKEKGRLAKIKYDSDLFYVKVFEYEDSSIKIDTPDGEIIVDAPSKVGDDDKSILDGLSIESILSNSYNSLKSLFKVFDLLGKLCYQLFVSLPNIFQTVLLYGFTIGIIIIILKIFL